MRTEVEARVRKPKYGKTASKDQVTGEMIKGEGDTAMDWIWRLCNMIFERGDVPENGRSAMIIPLYKGKGERIERTNYKSVSLLSGNNNGQSP